MQVWADMDIIGHIKTITAHKRMVRKYCFRLGLYKQGMLHDLSKYTPTEFIPGILYFQGDRSPNIRERERKGYSAAWMHHKGRNKHHIEYWNDYSAEPGKGIIAIEMPARYLAEMVCDRIAASKNYNKEKYHNGKPLEYFLSSKEHGFIHENTQRELVKILTMLRDKGEEETFRYLKYLLKKNRKQ